MDELESQIRSMNGMAKIYRTHNSELGMDALLGVQAFDLDRALEIAPELLNGTTPQHDWTVNSLALVESGELDWEKLNNWLSNLLETRGADIFRMKGILNMAGESERFVFQGVHMLFEGKPDRPWKKGESRKNELVFIGRNLDGAQMRRDFKQCMV